MQFLNQFFHAARSNKDSLLSWYQMPRTRSWGQRAGLQTKRVPVWIFPSHFFILLDLFN